MALSTTEEIIEDIRLGKMVILMDDEDRENEGDIIMAAEKITPEAVNFMARHACGLICLTLTAERCEQLDLPLMVDRNGTVFETNFTLSIEAAEGVSTGISAADRAHTVLTAVAPDAKAQDIVQPGHIFPLRAVPGGVLQRAGHTEAGCDLASLAGLEPAAVIVEVMNEDGTMARRADLEKFGAKHNIKIGTIADLIHYRAMNEATVKRGASYKLNTQWGEFNVISFQDEVQNTSHLALVKGQPQADKPTLVRVHQPDTMRDLFAAKSASESSSWSLQQAMAKIAAAEAGVLVVLDNAQVEQDLEQQLQQFLGAKPASRARDGAGTFLSIGTGAQILRELGVGKMRLLSSPLRFGALSGFDLEIVETLASSD